MDNPLRFLCQYGRAFCIAWLAWIRVVPYTTGSGISLQIPKTWTAVCANYEITIPQSKLRGWWREVTEREVARVGLRISPHGHKKSREFAHTYLETNGHPRDLSIGIRTRLAAQRAKYSLLQKYRAFILENSGMSPGEFSGITSALQVFLMIRRKTSVQELAVVEKLAHTARFTSFISPKSGRAVRYLAFVEADKCCWKPETIEETGRKVKILSEVLCALGNNRFVLHQLHCRQIRRAWRFSNGNKGNWKDVTRNIGDPFGHLRKDYRPVLRLARRTFEEVVYTVDMLGELAELVKGGKLDRRFVTACTSKYGVYMRPAEYEELFRLSRDPAWEACGLAGIAWLHHCQVPLGDMLLCVGLLPHTRTLAEARELAKGGVLPELLQELESAGLLPLDTRGIEYIHARCEENNPERVFALLKAGVVPQLLRSTLSLWDEFPGESAEGIKQAVQASATFAQARARLSGVVAVLPVHTEWQIPSPRKRKRRNTGVPSIEMEVAAVVERDNEKLARISPSSIPGSLTHQRLARGLRREQWVRLPSVGGHEVHEKEGRRLYVPGAHGQGRGGLKRYTLADALSQAGFSTEEVSRIVNR